LHEAYLELFKAHAVPEPTFGLGQPTHELLQAQDVYLLPPSAVHAALLPTTPVPVQVL
jgi:hypothetical protein